MTLLILIILEQFEMNGIATPIIQGDGFVGSSTMQQYMQIFALSQGLQFKLTAVHPIIHHGGDVLLQQGCVSNDLLIPPQQQLWINLGPEKLLIDGHLLACFDSQRMMLLLAAIQAHREGSEETISIPFNIDVLE